jgi:hypothetical protein
MQGWAPPVKLERRHMIYTLSVWRETQSNSPPFLFIEKPMAHNSIANKLINQVVQ